MKPPSTWRILSVIERNELVAIQPANGLHGAAYKAQHPYHGWCVEYGNAQWYVPGPLFRSDAMPDGLVDIPPRLAGQLARSLDAIDTELAPVGLFQWENSIRIPIVKENAMHEQLKAAERAVEDAQTRLKDQRAQVKQRDKEAKLRRAAEKTAIKTLEKIANDDGEAAADRINAAVILLNIAGRSV